MNCPRCPAPLICPEGGIAYCDRCGWGTPEWWAEHPPKEEPEEVLRGIEESLTVENIRLEQRISKLEKRNGELIDGILTHRRDTAPGASDVDRTLWATVIDPVP